MRAFLVIDLRLASQTENQRNLVLCTVSRVKLETEFGFSSAQQPQAQEIRWWRREAEEEEDEEEVEEKTTFVEQEIQHENLFNERKIT